MQRALVQAAGWITQPRAMCPQACNAAQSQLQGMQLDAHALGRSRAVVSLVRCSNAVVLTPKGDTPNRHSKALTWLHGACWRAALCWPKPWSSACALISTVSAAGQPPPSGTAPRQFPLERVRSIQAFTLNASTGLQGLAFISGEAVSTNTPLTAALQAEWWTRVIQVRGSMLLCWLRSGDLQGVHQCSACCCHQQHRPCKQACTLCTAASTRCCARPKHVALGH